MGGEYCRASSLFILGEEKIEDQVNSPHITIVDGPVWCIVVEPPELTRLHPELLIPAVQEAPLRTLQYEVVAPSDEIVVATVYVAVNATARREVDQLCPT